MLSLIRDLISLAASAELPASSRTSLAITAKPRPCSPARAASTAVFEGQLIGLMRVVDVLLDGAAELPHGGRSFFQGAGLFFCA
jgi:hypothetical protein